MATIYISDELQDRSPDYDLTEAWNNNQQDWALEDVKTVLATVAGANDELSWYWVIELKEAFAGPRYILAVGWCDYTGWDCQSGLMTYTANTAAEAAQQSPQVEDYTQRCICQCLLDQLSGKEPYGVYTSHAEAGITPADDEQ